MSKTDQKATEAKDVADKATEDQKSPETKAAEQKAADEKAEADAKATEEKGEDTSPELDIEKLRELSDLISANADRSFVNIQHRLVAEEGLKFRKTSEGRVYAKMVGIEAGSRGGEAVALQNWANAARRALLQAA